MLLSSKLNPFLFIFLHDSSYCLLAAGATGGVSTFIIVISMIKE
jgi:hypothetical protein